MITFLGVLDRRCKEKAYSRKVFASQRSALRSAGWEQKAIDDVTLQLLAEKQNEIAVRFAAENRSPYSAYSTLLERLIEYHSPGKVKSEILPHNWDPKRQPQTMFELLASVRSI